MNKTSVIRTDRLLLRQWNNSDFKAFAKLNADPCVREFFPSLLTEKQSNDQAIVFQQAIKERGYGFWAVEAIDVSKFIGLIGISPVDMNAHFCPHVEIGWRLAYEFWGKGYATEGAKACLEYGFEKLQLKEIVAFTAESNRRSRSVMEKIGMAHDANDDFNHPSIDEISPLKKHVLYRISNRQLLCPCHSGLHYGECCYALHLGKKPMNALQLMRSRYTAYAFGKADYIVKTTHPLNPMYSKNKSAWEKEIALFSKETTFHKLEILDYTERGLQATIVFKAHLFNGNKEISFTEKSDFEKVHGFWLYKHAHFV